MIQKLEYTDLNRFLVSIGLLMIVFSVFIQWLFLRENFDLLINTEELSRLTDRSVQILTKRQSNLIFLINVLPWISTIFGLLGICSVIIGVRRWYLKQIILDERDSITNEKLKTELRNMSIEETKEDHLKDIEEKLTQEDLSGDFEENLKRKEDLLINYISAQNSIAINLKSYYGKKYEILLNQKISNNNLGIDIVMIPKILHKDSNINHALFEIKTYESKQMITRKSLVDSTVELNNNLSEYKLSINNSRVGVIGFQVIISDEDTQFWNKLEEEVKEFVQPYNEIHWICIPKNEVTAVPKIIENLLK